MAKQKVASSKTSPGVPDKDQYTAGGPRPGPKGLKGLNANRAPKPEDRNDPEEKTPSETPPENWKTEGEPPYARTYKEPLDEDGDLEE